MRKSDFVVGHETSQSQMFATERSLRSWWRIVKRQPANRDLEEITWSQPWRSIELRSKDSADETDHILVPKDIETVCQSMLLMSFSYGMEVWPYNWSQ